MSNAIDLFNRIGQVDDTAAELGIRPELLHSVLRQESGGNPNALSPKGAQGLMQVMPATARDPGFGVKPFNPANPEENLRGGASYLKAMLDRYPGDEAKALAAYNAGPGRVDKAGGVPNIPETQQYVQRVSGQANGAAPTQANTAPQSAIDLFNSVGAPPETPQAAVIRLGKERAAEEAANAPGQRFKTGVATTANPADMARGLSESLHHPWETVKSLGSSLVDQGKQAAEAFHQGRYANAAAHGAAAVGPPLAAAAALALSAPVSIPAALGSVVGAGLTGLGAAALLPSAADAGEYMTHTGDIAGGLGRGVGLLAQAVAPDLAGKAVKGAGNLVKGGAERIIYSNVKPGQLAKQNPGINIPRVILDQGFGPGERGFNKAAGRVTTLGDELSEASDNATDKGGRGSLQPMLDHLNQLEKEFQHQPNSTADLAAVRDAREALMNNPLYSKDKIVQVATPVQVPAVAPSTILGPNGQPMTPGSAGYTTYRYAPQVISREPILSQSLSEIDRMKKNVYQGLKGKMGREGNGPVEVDKAMGRGLKDTLNQNIPAQDGLRSAADINKEQAGVITARNALENMMGREKSKYPLGLMDATFGAAGAAGAAVNPLLAAPAAAAILLKHPTTAFPIARGIDAVGKTVGKAAPGAKGATQGLVAARGVQQSEFKRLYDPNILDH